MLARYNSSCKVKLTVQRAALLPTLVNIKKMLNILFFIIVISVCRLRRMSR